MRKRYIILSALFITLSLSVKSQYNYAPFRFDLGMGVSIPAKWDAFGIGLGFSAEPKYSVLPRLSVGLRNELNFIFNFDDYFYDDYDSGYATRANFKSNYMLMATADYHFTTATFRPFIGGGAGIAVLGGSTFRDDDRYWEDRYWDDVYNLNTRVNFGGMLRAGFDVTHFRLAFMYNYCGKNDGINFNYFALSLGGYIGGWKRRN